jgi:nucleotide-binding universal stress UspA family protein
MAQNVDTLIALTDGAPASLAALPDLARLARQLGDRLALLHLLSAADFGDRAIAATVARLGGAQPAVLAIRPENLAPALATFATAGGRLLALRPTRRGGLLRVLAGNLEETLLRASPLPILALPERGQLPPIRRALFAADLAPRSDRALDQAIALCRQLGAELHILHAFGDDGLLPSERDSARRAATATVRDLLAIDREQLQSLLSRASDAGVAAQLATAEGRAHDAILGYAASNAIDLMVMAPHGPRSVEDILLGSTTARVIRAARVPVLAFPA